MSAAPQRQTRKQRSKEESNKLAEQRENTDAPGKHATPGRREYATPRSAPG
jgi:hypothetical protein